ncbi:MAG: hypothetical protein P1V97_31890 [Planctomycetota bacterium]|nr:hypothetical protein [Planctomycetota bacterium]
MDPRVDRVLDYAVNDGDITAPESMKVKGYVAKKNGDLEMALDLLRRFHKVTKQRTAELCEYLTTESVQEMTGNIALVQLPLDGEATDAQLEAYAAAMGTEIYDAKTRFYEKLPRILRVGTEEELHCICDFFDDADIPHLLSEADAIFDGDPWRVNEVHNQAGRLFVSGEEGTEELELNERALLVIGRYKEVTTKKTTTKRTRPRMRGHLGPRPTVTTTTTTNQSDFELFGQLFFESHERPYILSEATMTNFEVLGAAKGISRRTNFQCVLDMIKGPKIERNDALYTHANLVKATEMARKYRSTMRRGMLTRQKTQQRTKNTSTNEMADIYARIYYYSWL